MTAPQDALLRKSEQSLNAAGLLLGNGYPDFAVGRACFAMLYAAPASGASRQRLWAGSFERSGDR